jgi:hypothetical protein
LIEEESARDIESRREKAEKEKAKGNAAFGKGMYRRASKHFTAAMNLVRGLEPAGLLRNRVRVLTTTCSRYQDPDFPVYPLNRAASSLKLERYVGYLLGTRSVLTGC